MTRSTRLAQIGSRLHLLVQGSLAMIMLVIKIRSDSLTLLISRFEHCQHSDFAHADPVIIQERGYPHLTAQIPRRSYLGLLETTISSCRKKFTD